MSKNTEIKKVTLMQVIDAQNEMNAMKKKVGSGKNADNAYVKACEKFTYLSDLYLEQNPSMERSNRPNEKTEVESCPQKSKPKNFRPRDVKKMDQVLDM